MPTIQLAGFGGYSASYYSTDGGDYDYGTAPVSAEIELTDDHLLMFDDDGLNHVAGAVMGISLSFQWPGYTKTFAYDDMVSGVFEVTSDGYTYVYELYYEIERLVIDGVTTDTLHVTRGETAYGNGETHEFWFPLAGPALPDDLGFSNSAFRMITMIV